MLAATKPPESTDGLHFLTHALVVTWPLWALVAAVGAGKLLAMAWQLRRLRRAGIFEIDAMSGGMFEQRLSVLFRSLGYRSEIVGSGGGDYGGDLVIAKGGRRTVVQAKCWKKNVGVKAVQEALGARGYYRADAALVVTNARFTKQAQVLAGKNDVELWDRDELVAALLRAQKGKGGTLAPQRAPVEEAVPQVAASGSELAVAREVEATATAVVAASAAFCARCGDPVSDKVRDYCLAHPARFQGLIYCFRHQRAFKRTR